MKYLMFHTLLRNFIWCQA